MRAWRMILVSTLAMAATPSAAQRQSAPATPPPVPGATTPPTTMPPAGEPDIVVEGYRLRRDLDTAVKYPTNVSTIEMRRRYDAAERMARCAARSSLSDLGWLRRVVDGEVNSPPHVFAQDRLTRIYASCGDGSNLLLRQGEYASPLEAVNAFMATDGARGSTAGYDPFPLGRSALDRGAYMVSALKRFAPGLTLTRAETGDPAVQARFALREGPRNRFRFSADRSYFDVASCMVRQQPQLAVRLAVSDGAARFGDLQAALIDRARDCVGGARDVQVDPSQFRVYIADAVYRWAVAARNVASLIPPDASRGG